MTYKRLMLLIIIAFIFTGCNLYETREDKQGRTVRVNKITGEVAIIDGDKIIKVKSDKDIAKEKANEDELRTTKIWNTMILFNNVPVEFKTMWSNGNMSYQLRIKQNLRPKSNYLSTICVVLKDKDEFQITSIPIRTNELVGVVGIDGKTIFEMTHSDQIPIVKEDYKRIASCELSWSGFKESSEKQ